MLKKKLALNGFIYRHKNIEFTVKQNMYDI